MTYLQTHKRPYQRLKQTISLIVVFIILIIIVIQLTLPHVFPGLFTAIARPFWRTEFSIESGSLDAPEALLQEKESLLRKLSEAQVRIDTIQAIEQENAELKVLLGREPAASALASASTTPTYSKTSTEAGKQGILAAVLKRPPFAAYDELIIDIGVDHELATTSLVYIPGDVLIGRVIDVLGTTAKVKLFSSSGESYSVFIGPTHSVATAVGRGGGQYEAQVSSDTVVEEGDFVLSSFLNDKPFGVVRAVLLDPTQPFKTILFAPPVNIYQLRWVLVKNNE